MGFKSKSNHVIDMLFPLSLFFVFSVSALFIVVLSSNVYQSTYHVTENTFTSRTAISYLCEKVRQNDQTDAISIAEIDDTTCLVIDQIYDDALYTTYIYQRDGYLTELFVAAGANFSLDHGSQLLNISDFSATLHDGNILSLAITTMDATTSQVDLLLKSGGSL